jgi:hypothetical protein
MRPPWRSRQRESGGGARRRRPRVLAPGARRTPEERAVHATRTRRKKHVSAREDFLLGVFKSFRSFIGWTLDL